MKLKVKQIFPTIQGEGSWTGIPATFIRLGFCNLSCVWCDTLFDNPDFMEISEILQIVQKNPAKHIVITGGEPTLQIEKLKHLVHDLRIYGYKVGIETNGTIPFDIRIFDHVTISPKENVEMANKGQEVNRSIKQFKCHDLKIIYEGQSLEELNSSAERFDYLKGKYLQPLSNTPESIKKTADLVASTPDWKLSLQTHKIIGLP